MKAKRKGKVKGGRPTKFRVEMVEQARKLYEIGLTDIEVADFFGITDRTLYRWQADQPAFCQARKLGKDVPDDKVERSLFHRATGYSHKAVKIFADPKTGAEKIVEYVEHYPPDATSCIFWLKNRRPEEWRDRIEHTGKDGGPIQTEELGDTERARRIAFLLQKGLTPTVQ